jgi:hypothetical protein
MMNYLSKEKKSRTEILNGFLVAMIIILISSLPYFHEIIIDSETGLQSWAPILGIEQLLTDANGEILSFSSYRVFLYTFLIFLFSQIGWTIWLLLSKRKTYYLALFAPAILGWYQVLIILLNLRKTPVNSLSIKLYFLVALTILLSFLYLRNHKFNLRKILKLTVIIAATTLPFLHDILTERSGEIRSWVPIVGMQNFFTDSNGDVLGFWNYRVFTYTIMLHIYAHLGWLGAFVYFYYPKLRKVRSFLLVPVALSFYSIIIILLNWQGKGFNQPDVKFYITIVLSILLAINYFFNHKKEREGILSKTIENEKT